MCHDVLMLFMIVNDIPIINICSAKYCCIIAGITKSEVINLSRNTDLSEKGEHYKIQNNHTKNKK